MIMELVPRALPILTYELGKAYWIALTDQRARTKARYTFAEACHSFC